jgi:ActR/RegA family two-component response regulator
MDSQTADETKPVEAQPRPASAIEKAPSLLIIDDDPVQRMTMGKVGSKAGYTVATAGSVEEAVVALGQAKYDFITLDLLLGGQNGIVALGEIAKTNPDALLVIVSGASAAVRESTLSLTVGFRLNAVELPKPVDLSAFRVLLKSHPQAA